MPITFRCSNCAQVLKVADTLAGGKGKCPKCGAVLLVPGAKTKTSEAPAPPAARKARAPQPAIIEEKAVRKRPRAAEAPSGEDEAPDEAMPRPRDVRKKNKKRKTSPLLLYGVIGGCFSLLIVFSGVGVLTWWFFSSGGLAGDDLTYMPNNCQMIASVRVDQLMQGQVFQDMRREIPEIEKGLLSDFDKEVGLAMNDIEQAVIGVGPTGNDVICVLHTKNPVDAKDIRSRIKNGNFTETKVGKYLMQNPQNIRNPAFCVLDKKRVVLGDKEVLQAVLLRDKKPEFSKNLQDALKHADFSKTIAYALDAQSMRPKFGNAFPPFLGGKNDIVSAQKKINGFAVQAAVGSDIRLELAIICQDPAGANEVKKVIEGFLNEIKKMIESFQAIQGNNQGMPKEIADLLQLNLKVDGSKVTGGNTIKADALLKMYKQQKGKL